MPSEFNLIKKYFTRPCTQADLGVGDDAALIQVSPGNQLAISTDMLVAGTHFLADCKAWDIGWKSLAVNLSDMAAMGATPKWATLSIALPNVDEVWLAEFSKGFFACADKFGVGLIGGDTTRGPLNISVQIMGEVPNGKALQRDSAQAGDEIWVSGTLGEAALGLAYLQNKLEAHTLSVTEIELCVDALQQPEPRIALGLTLRDIAHSAIDVSDGLIADLGHVLTQSQLGADLYWEKIPHVHVNETLDAATLQSFSLAGGDDYELCFTAPPTMHKEILKIGDKLDLKLSPIGITTLGSTLNIFDAHDQRIELKAAGYDHFS